MALACGCKQLIRDALGWEEEVMVDLTELCDSVPATVRALRRAGLDLAIASTRYRLRIEAILARDGLRGDFPVIVGG